MLELLRICLLPLLLTNLIGHAHCSESPGDDNTSPLASSEASKSTATISTMTPTALSLTSASANATCLSRTANYITHTLPQQCLRTDRVAANTTQSSTPLETESLDAGTVTPTDPGPRAPDPTATSISESHSKDTSSATPPGAEPENDSPLDNANFLSFEEWKKQNLAKSGQSLENVGNGRTIEGIRERPINNALESYGDEGEIDLDFSGFGADSNVVRPPSKEPSPAVTAVDAANGELVPALRSKDAGKTCKERTNYASFDCAANVLKSNSECKSSSSVLVENKDSYMLNTCSVKNKFFIVELCDDILIDTIVLANYEFFSSMFRYFRVSVSDRYPVKADKWKDLGAFEARNVREVQAFLVERPQIWARYLRIEFLSHYGSEYYCPVSLLRVHGTTMLEDYRHQEEIAQGDHSEESTLEVEGNATPAMPQEPMLSTDETSKDTMSAMESVETPTDASTAVAKATELKHNVELLATSPAENVTVLLLQALATLEENSTCAPFEGSTNMQETTENVEAPGTGSNITSDVAGDQQSSDSNSISKATTSPRRMTRSPTSAVHPTTQESASTNRSEPHKHASLPVPDASNSTGPSEHGEAPEKNINSTSSQPSPSSATSNVSSPDTLSASTNSSRHSPPSSTVAAAPQAATQESFYKSVHKRLQQLESNSTLSLQYIEEQSRILRDAFSKVEKRQITATTSFLTALNSTVMAELQGFRQAYDQLWQSTVIELEGQREQYQREMLAMGSRLTLVAEELVWQKRMGIVQSTLLLLCLGLVLFARQGNGYLEMPLMQQMVHRSQTALARAGWESPPASPSPMSRSPVSLFRRKLWRSHTEPTSGNVTDATDSRPQSKEGPGPEVVIAPPTPPRDDVDSAIVDDSEGGDVEDEAFEDVWESRSGPATPRGTREGSAGASDSGQGVGWLDPGASGAVDVDVVDGR